MTVEDRRDPADRLENRLDAGPKEIRQREIRLTISLARLKKLIRRILRC